jgi:hypothetical protein
MATRDDPLQVRSAPLVSLRSGSRLSVVRAAVAPRFAGRWLSSLSISGRLRCRSDRGLVSGCCGGAIVEFLLVLSEDIEVVASAEDHRRAVQRTGEYVMRLVGEGRMGP